MLQEGGLPATTMHQRLYDFDLQLDDMAQAGVDLSVLHVCSAGRRRLRSAGLSTMTWRRFRKNIRGASLAWRSVDPGRHRGGLIEARLVLRQPEKLPVFFYRSTAGLAKLAST